MAVKLNPAYMQAMKRFYKNHPDKLAQAHLSHLGNSALDEETQQEVINQNNPGLAHHPDLAAIGEMPKSEQAKAVQQLHEQESRGPVSSEEDEYIRKHPKKDTSMLGRHYGARR